MDELYYDCKKPDSYGSHAGLARQSKKTKKEIDEFLQKQDAYTLHKNIKHKFRRRRTFTLGINDLWQIDLVDLSSLSKSNDGYRYLLMCIDVFSKYGRIVPLKSKQAIIVRDAFASLIQSVKPNLLQSDKGTEFWNAPFKKLVTDNNIKHYSSENDDIKCAVVERWNRTILNKLFRYLTHKNNSRYIDVIQDLVHSYNNTYHSTIKMTPSEVTEENENEVRKLLFQPKPKRIKYKFAVGDVVRISETRRAFLKGYREKWTEEIFKVAHLHATDPPTYSITDWSDEPIKGKFYAEELQKVVKETFAIEKVLKTRRRGDKREFFVKWVGYPEKFNSWTTDLVNIN